jgi:hypothetical protein
MSKNAPHISSRISFASLTALTPRFGARKLSPYAGISFPSFARRYHHVAALSQICASFIAISKVWLPDWYARYTTALCGRRHAIVTTNISSFCHRTDSGKLSIDSHVRATLLGDSSLFTGLSIHPSRDQALSSREKRLQADF